MVTLIDTLGGSAGGSLSVTTRHGGGTVFCNTVGNSSGEKFQIADSCLGWMNWWEARWVRQKVSDWLPYHSQQLWAKHNPGIKWFHQQLSSKEAWSVLPVPLQQSQPCSVTLPLDWALSTLFPVPHLMPTLTWAGRGAAVPAHPIPPSRGSWGRREGAGKQGQTLAVTAGSWGWLWVNPEWAVRCFTDT